MANFTSAFAATMKAEGGYVNHPHDPGGETYKGVARKLNSKWDGWIIIDLAKRGNNFPASLDSNQPLQEKISAFYETNYWDKIRGDDITDQHVAESIFDFAVNAGPVTSARLAQLSVNANPDGVIGSTTLQKINAEDPRTFLSVFALHKIRRYMQICDQKPTSKDFFYGWVRRTLEVV